MPKRDSATEAFFRSLLPGEGNFIVKPMFGHAAAFVNGNMFAGTFGEHVFVRLSDEDGLELLKEKGAAPFSPMEGRPMKGYIVIPPSWRSDKTNARLWIAKSYAWISEAPPKEKKKKKTITASRKGKKD